MAVPVTTGTSFTHHYTVSHDGQRFLIATAVEGAHSVPISVVLNWDAALKK